MLESPSLPFLLGVFVAATAVVWWSGIRLSNTTDALDRRFGWGDALGGLVLLALVTDLPDLAIVVSASLGGNADLATGTLLGGVAVQNVVLAVLDFAGGGSGLPLTSRTTTLVPAVEVMMVISGLTLVILGSQMEPMTSFGVEPAAILIVIVWVAGVLLVRRAQAGLAWTLDEDDDAAGDEDTGESEGDERSTGRVVVMFLFAAVLTVIGGFFLERSGERIASDLGIGGVAFGATFLAVATALPDVSTGTQAVRLGDHQLAISDVLGASAFLPSLFLVAGVLSGEAVIAATGKTNIYLGALGVMLMAPYLIGLVFRSRHTTARMGYDSLVSIVLYLLGVVGLFLFT